VLLQGVVAHRIGEVTDIKFLAHFWDLSKKAYTF
jgi:hypothetical protein